MSEAPDETTHEDETQEQDGPEPLTEPTPEEQEGDEEESDQVEGVPAEPEGAGAAATDAQADAQTPTLSQQEIEKRLKALDKEGERHAKRVHEIMGESMADLTPCELCWPFAPGFRFEPIPDEQRARAMLVLGMSGVGNYAPDTHSHACEDCLGYGMVATGSKVQGQDALPCLTCKGDGWLGDRKSVQALAPVAPAVVEQANGTSEVVPLSPDAQEAKRAAEAAGFIVIDTHAPATT